MQLFVGVGVGLRHEVFWHEKGLRYSEDLWIHDGGDEGDRTPDLLTASQALSQLSYAPVRRSTIRELRRRCKGNFGKTFARAGTGETRPARSTGFPVLRQSHYRTRLRTAPPLRLRTMPVYYDESGMFDHARLFTQPSGSLPAVLQTGNTRCSGVADQS